MKDVFKWLLDYKSKYKCNHKWFYKHHKRGYKATCVVCKEVRLIKE